jgi:hypothetical protein
LLFDRQLFLKYEAIPRRSRRQTPTATRSLLSRRFAFTESGVELLQSGSAWRMANGDALTLLRYTAFGWGASGPPLHSLTTHLPPPSFLILRGATALRLQVAGRRGRRTLEWTAWHLEDLVGEDPTNI